MGENERILKIVDLAGINFSNLAITCSINSKMCLILAGAFFLGENGAVN